MREILTKNVVCLSWQSMNYVFPIVGDSFCFFFFLSKNFIIFCLKKNDKVERMCFLYGVLFFSFFGHQKTSNIKYTLYHLWASKMVENRLIC